MDNAKLSSKGGFTITKWISNSNTLLVLLQQEIAKSSIEINSIPNETEKILGILWNFKKDTLNVR